MSTSLTTTAMSDPENCSVRRPSSSNSRCVIALGVSPRWILNMLARAGASGSGMWMRLSKRRRTALSSA
jgi:hypothetical protein